ncbi:MAG TPA: PIG-L family deacetylase [Burkholderiales bacterium]|nr:PIG-L family deacetylase [Burkholderiales bacterium]
MNKLLVISPHLDDAAFACGDLLAAHPGSTVVTVFAGIPEGFSDLTEWDAVCGFVSARDAVLARRREDETALSVLGAQPRWLPFRDAQYGEAARSIDITRALRGIVKEVRCDTVLFPLGLFHSDHELTHSASLALLHERLPLRWICYEDTFYRCIPGLVQRRIERLSRGHHLAGPVANSKGLTSAKRQAVYCYASQLRGLSSAGKPGHLDALTVERYWPLSVEEAVLH